MKKKFLNVLMLSSAITFAFGITSCVSNDDTNKKEVITLTLKEVTNNNLEVGDSLTLSLEIKNTNKKAKFISTNSDVLSVDDNGKITAKNVGTAKIYAEIEANDEVFQSNSIKFNVLAKSNISVTLPQKETMLIVNETYEIKPVVTGNPNNYPVTFLSSDNGILSVTSEGKVTALKEGKAKVSVLIKDIERASIEFNVFKEYVPCETINVAQKNIYLSINEEYVVEPTFTPINAIKEFTLTSEDPSSVKIDGNKIIGLKETEDLVKVTLKSGSVSLDLSVFVSNNNNLKVLKEVKSKLDESLILEETLAKNGNLTISNLDEKDKETSKKLYDFEVFNDNKTSTIYTSSSGGKDSVTRYVAGVVDNVFVNSTENKENDKFFFDTRYSFRNKKIGEGTGEIKKDEANKLAHLPIVGQDKPNGLSSYINKNYFASYSNFGDSEFLNKATYTKSENTFTFNVTQETEWDKKVLSGTLEIEDNLIKSFSSTITSFNKEDYSDGTNFVFNKKEKVGATMNKGTRVASSGLKDYSKLACTDFNLEFKVKGEAKTEFNVGDTVSVVFKGTPETYNDNYDPLNIMLSDKTVGTYNVNKKTLILKKACNELKITASTFNVTKEYTIKVKSIAAQSLEIESAEIGLVSETISGKISVNPSKASTDLEYEIINGNKENVTVTGTPGTTYNAPSFKFVASASSKYTLKVTDKISKVSVTKDINIFDDSDAGIASLIKACNVTFDNESLTNFNLTFDSETSGNISFTYNMEDKNSHYNKLNFNQKFSIKNKTIVLEKSSTTHFINKVEFATNLDGSVDYSLLKISCFNSEEDTTENTITLNLSVK